MAKDFLIRGCVQQHPGAVHRALEAFKEAVAAAQDSLFSEEGAQFGLLHDAGQIVGRARRDGRGQSGSEADARSNREPDTNILSLGKNADWEQRPCLAELVEQFFPCPGCRSGGLRRCFC